MSDDADLAQSQMEREEEIRKRYKPSPVAEVQAIGFCLNCSEALPKHVRWCSQDCQEDWTRRKNANM
jgi:hypothetical protein